MIYPPWVKLLVPVAIAIVIFFAGFKVSSWKWSGRVEKAVAAQEKAEKEARERVALEEQWRRDIRALKAEMEESARKQSELQAAYEAAVNAPPEVVVEYRDRWHSVPATIVSHDCLEGVSQLFTFIQDLPERPQ